MLNPLIMFGGKRGPDMGHGLEFDICSNHHIQSDGSVKVTTAELGRVLIRRPPQAKMSGAFAWRYCVSVWIAPHKWVSGGQKMPFLGLSVVPADATFSRPSADSYSYWGISQTKTPVSADGAQDTIWVGHHDGSNQRDRSFLIKKNAWTHIFVSVDTSRSVPEDRQKVWINGTFAAGGGISAAHTLQDQALHTQWPANPFMQRKFNGWYGGWDAPISSAHSQNFAMNIGSYGSFWDKRPVIAHPDYNPYGSVAAVYFIDDSATVDQIGAFDPITNIWTQHPALPVFGGASFYLNFKDRTGDPVGENANIAKDQLGNTEAVAYNSYQNVTGNRAVFRGKAEILTYPKVL